MSLKILCYTSSHALWLNQDDLNNILSQALSKNIDEGVNGFLLTSKGKFFHVIEGEVEVIENLFNKIKKDSRHDQIKLLFNKIMDERFFHKFSSRTNIIINSDEYQCLMKCQFIFSLDSIKDEIIKYLEPFYLSSL